MNFNNNIFSINHKKAFTLVELIVVITILAILGTIAFISFGNYTTTARDSNRQSDVKSMGITLENYYNKMGSFPMPSNSTGITYSGSTLFYHGSFGESVTINVKEISKIPKDPLFKVEYNYSITSQKNAYQIGYIQEGTDLTYNFINNANAAETFREVIGKTHGSYNGLVVGGSDGSIVYVFSAPSIILNDATYTDITQLTDKFVYDSNINIPSNYKDSGIMKAGALPYEPKLVYTGSTLPSTPTQLKPLIDNLKLSIHNINHPTPLFSNPSFKPLIELDSDNPDELSYFGDKYINRDLGGRFELKYAKNCKELLGTNEDKGNGNYTISPDGLKKLNVYCDMTTDGGGWTRVRRRERGIGYTEGGDITKTRILEGVELMTRYTRYGNIRVLTGGIRQDLDLSGKQYGLYYKRFKTKQWDYVNSSDIYCGEHTTLEDLISQVKGGTRGDCGRNCAGGQTSCNTALEYIDIQVDDFGSTNTSPILTNDKLANGYEKDPCITQGGHKYGSHRNVSWNSNGVISHRIDNSTTLTSLGGTTNTRCAGYDGRVLRYQNNISNETNPSGTWHTMFNGVTIDNRYEIGFQTNEVYIR